MEKLPVEILLLDAYTALLEIFDWDENEKDKVLKEISSIIDQNKNISDLLSRIEYQWGCEAKDIVLKIFLMLASKQESKKTGNNNENQFN
jgi:hypothetical protein